MRPPAGKPWAPLAKTQYFYDLTPERIHGAFASAGLEIKAGVTFLNSMENRVVRVEDVEGERWVAKFYRPGRWNIETLREEHDFVFELFDEGLPMVCPRPLRTRTGVETIGETVGIFFAVFPFQPGRQPDEMDGPLAHTVGNLLGQMHQIGYDYDFRHRPKLGPAYWGLDALAILEQEAVVPRDLWPNYRGQVQKLVERVQKRFERETPLRIHGDLHRGNLLITSQGPVLVDFDDCGMGPAVQDMWLLVPGRDSEAQELRQLMLEGYQQHLAFDRRQFELVEPLRALKFVHYAAWVARRRHDPAFRRLFPDVESPAFWRRELDELRGQIGLLGSSF
jgi:Ser/Thr protein kinase RdoA (MazF antagonist)